VNSEEYQAVIDSNHLLEQQLEEFKFSANQANDARLKAEQAKKNALEQLHIIRLEAEIQREDLRSAESETKKAWKIVGEANSKASAQAKQLKEAKEAQLQISAKAATLQRSMDEMSASTKLGSVEKSRLETEISTLQRRLKMEQALTRRVEEELAEKTKEVGAARFQGTEHTKAKIATLTDQKEKLEIAVKAWQNRHADIAARLDASETHKSRAILEVEDLVSLPSIVADCRIMNLPDLNRLEQRPSDLQQISRFRFSVPHLIVVNGFGGTE
jgi:chromosome segregation ATPase